MLAKIIFTISLLIGISTVSVANPKNLYAPINNSNSLAERNSRFKFLDTVAKAVTVKIYVGEDRVSGVLIDGGHYRTEYEPKYREIKTYTVVTNSNIVNRGNTYRIETSDGVMHKVSRSNQDSVLGIGHWSQVKKIRTKSRKLKNRVKLIENRQLKNLISP